MDVSVHFWDPAHVEFRALPLPQEYVGPIAAQSGYDSIFLDGADEWIAQVRHQHGALLRNLVMTIFSDIADEWVAQVEHQHGGRLAKKCLLTICTTFRQTTPGSGL